MSMSALRVCREKHYRLKEQQGLNGRSKGELCIAHPLPARHFARPRFSPFPHRAHYEITVLAPVLQKRTCSWSEVTIGDPATPNAAEVSNSMSVKGQKGDGGNILAL